MGFNSAFKGFKMVKNPGNGSLNNLNDPVLNVLRNTALFKKNSNKSKETFMRDLSPRNGRYVSALNDFLSERKL